MAWRFLLIAALLLSGPAGAQTPAPVTGPLPRPDLWALVAPADPRTEAALFAMPEIADETRRALGLIDAGDPEAAAAIFDALIDRHPEMGLLRARRAAVAMLAGDPDRAIAELEAAADVGFDELAEALTDPLFAPIAFDPAIAALAALPPAPAPPPPEPALVLGRSAPVGAGNTGWNPETERLEPRFAFPETTDAPVLAPAPRSPRATSCASMSAAAAPPATSAISTTTATAAIRR